MGLGGPNCGALHNSVLRAPQLGPPGAQRRAHGRLTLLPSSDPLNPYIIHTPATCPSRDVRTLTGCTGLLLGSLLQDLGGSRAQVSFAGSLQVHLYQDIRSPGTPIYQDNRTQGRLLSG